MRTDTVAVISAACLSWLIPFAYGTLFVSNMDQTPTGDAALGSDSRIAQSFNVSASDPNQYALDSIQLRLSPAVGSPSGLEVSVYSSALDAAPQVYLGTLAGSADPLMGGVYNYTASGITLSGLGSYFVVVTSMTPIAQGAFMWSSSDSYTRNGSWAIRSVYYTSSNGLAWEGHSREKVFQMAIYATVVPEPATLGLAGLGLGFLWLLRRKASRQRSPGTQCVSPSPRSSSPCMSP